jgi:hypothetical protein
MRRAEDVETTEVDGAKAAAEPATRAARTTFIVDVSMNGEIMNE